MDSLALQRLNQPLLRWLNSFADSEDDPLQPCNGWFLAKIWQQIDDCSQLHSIEFAVEQSNDSPADQHSLLPAFSTHLDDLLASSSSNSNSTSGSESSVRHLTHAHTIYLLLHRIVQFYERTLGQLPILPLPDPFAIASLHSRTLFDLTCSSSANQNDASDSNQLNDLNQLDKSNQNQNNDNVADDKRHDENEEDKDDNETDDEDQMKKKKKKNSRSSNNNNDDHQNSSNDSNRNRKSEHNNSIVNNSIDCCPLLDSTDESITLNNESKQPEQHLHTLLLLLLGCAVQCDRKQQFIERIKQLDLETQHALVGCIRRVTDDSTCVWPALDWPTLSAVPDLSPDRVYDLLLSHLRSVCAQRQLLIARCAVLVKRLQIEANTAKDSRKCVRCNQSANTSIGHSECVGTCLLHCGSHSLNSFVSDAPSIVSPEKSSSSSSSSEQLLQQLRCQLRDARAELDERTEQLAELQEQLRQCRESNAKQAAEHVQLTQQAREAKMYRDEVDVLQERLRSMQTAQQELDRYRARWAEFERMQRQCQQLTEENRLLADAKHVCQEQLNKAQQRLEAASELETQLLQARACISELRAQREDDRQRVDSLCDRIAELEVERRLADERLADCQAQLRSARRSNATVAKTSELESSLHSAELSNKKTNDTCLNHESNSNQNTTTRSDEAFVCESQTSSQHDSLELSQQLERNGQAANAAGSLLEQINNETAKRLLQLELENQKLQCALDAERAKQVQKSVELNVKEIANQLSNQMHITSSDSLDKKAVVRLKSEANRLTLNKESVRISEHASESDSGCVSLTGESSSCGKCRRCSSDRPFALNSHHLCNPLAIRSNSSASNDSSSSSTAEGSNSSVTSGASSGPENNSEEDSSIPIERIRPTQLIKPNCTGRAANTAILRPIRQMHPDHLRSKSPLQPSKCHTPPADSIGKLNSSIQTELHLESNDRYRSVSTSTNSLPSSPVPPTQMRSTVLVPSALACPSLHSASVRPVDQCHTPPPKLPPRSQPTPPKQVQHSPNCRLNSNLNVLSLTNSNLPPSTHQRFASLSSSSNSGNSTFSDLHSLNNPTHASAQHSHHSQANATIHNRIAISFGSNASSSACTSTSSNSSVYVRNDLRRTPTSTRQTFQLTTTSSPAAGNHQLLPSNHQTMSPNNNKTDMNNSSFISIRSTVGQMSPKRMTTTVSPLQSNVQTRIQSLPASPAQCSNGTGNTSQLTSGAYRNPNFIRGNSRSYNYGHKHPRVPEYSLIKHEPVTSNRQSINSSDSINGSASVSLRAHRPEVAYGSKLMSNNPPTRTIQNCGQAFNFLTSSISSPSLNSESDDESTNTVNLTSNAVNLHKETSHAVTPNHLRSAQPMHATESPARNLSNLNAIESDAYDVSPLRRSHTLMLNSNGKPEIARANRNSDHSKEANSGLSSPISTVSTKSIWYEYGCV